MFAIKEEKSCSSSILRHQVVTWNMRFHVAVKYYWKKKAVVLWGEWYPEPQTEAGVQQCRWGCTQTSSLENRYDVSPSRNWGTSLPSFPRAIIKGAKIVAATAWSTSIVPLGCASSAFSHPFWKKWPWKVGTQRSQMWTTDLGKVSHLFKVNKEDMAGHGVSPRRLQILCC